MIVYETQRQGWVKRGIKQASRTRRSPLFIGSNAKISFNRLALDMVGRFSPTNTDVASLGEIYHSGIYEGDPNSKERTYEPAFGDLDWSKAVAADPTALSVLQDAFGDRDADLQAFQEESLKRVYGPFGSTINVLSVDEVSLNNMNAESGERSAEDEDTRGVRGVDDFDAPIDPFA